MLKKIIVFYLLKKEISYVIYNSLNTFKFSISIADQINKYSYMDIKYGYKIAKYAKLFRII